MLGFSRQTVALLNEMGAEYSTFNILLDDEVRQGGPYSSSTELMRYTLYNWLLLHLAIIVCSG